MVHPDDLPVLMEAAVETEQAGHAEAEYRQLTKNGEYRWLSNRMSLTMDGDGRPLYRNGNIRDVTEHKKAEEEERKEHDQTVFANRILRMFVEQDGDELFHRVLTAVQKEMDSEYC